MLRLVGIELQMHENSHTVPIIRGVDLEFKSGKMYAITGPNGGGKTSLAKVIFGAYKPTSGKLFFEGKDITALDITERARLGIAYAFQQPPRFKGLTVKELLKIASGCESDNVCIRKMRTSLRKVGLCPEDYLERELDASLSGGEMKRIELATVLIRRPKLAILDEPEAGIDLWSYSRLVNVLVSSRGNNETIVVITHQEKVLSQADEIILIGKGEVLGQGDPVTMMPLLKTEEGLCRWRMSCTGDEDVECN